MHISIVLIVLVAAFAIIGVVFYPSEKEVIKGSINNNVEEATVMTCKNNDCVFSK
jgi:hypothetical protein